MRASLWRFVQRVYREQRSRRRSPRRCGASSRSRACRRSCAPDALEQPARRTGRLSLLRRERPAALHRQEREPARPRALALLERLPLARTTSASRARSSRIEVEETAGELGALLREARLVKELLPLHNYRLRRKLNAVLHSHARPRERRPRSSPTRTSTGPRAARGAETLYGPFATKLNVRQLLEELARRAGPVLAPASAGRSAAALASRARCGSAAARASARRRPRRTTCASPPRWRRIACVDWPFEGRIVVRERHPESGIEEAPRVRALVATWARRAARKSWPSCSMLAVEIDFDPDVYRILAAHIAKHRRPVRPLARPPAARDASRPRPP